MSRSYRKPLFMDKKSKFVKKQLSRIVRKNKDLPNGNAYRKLVCSWEICEFKIWINPSDERYLKTRRK